MSKRLPIKGKKKSNKIKLSKLKELIKAKKQKIKKEEKQEDSKISVKKLRMIIISVVLIFIILIGRIIYIEFGYTVDGKKLKEKAYLQSTQNKIITAKRGTIYDRNGKALAISADVDTITANPEYLKVKTKGEFDQIGRAHV